MALIPYARNSHSDEQLTIWSFRWSYTESRDVDWWMLGQKCRHIWAMTWENLSWGVCEPQRRRPACASAQSDQRLCYSLFGMYHVLTCYRWTFNFLASLWSWRDWFGTRFVGNPEDRFSRVEAHITLDNNKACMVKGWLYTISNILAQMTIVNSLHIG